MNAETASTLPHTVYYDGACPLCTGEMALLKARNTAGKLVFVDIATPGFDPAPLGATLAAMLTLMHVRTPEGRWLIGIPAFVVIYKATGFHGVARWLRRPWAARIAARVYPWLVRNRYVVPQPLVRAALRVQGALNLARCDANGACRID